MLLLVFFILSVLSALGAAVGFSWYDRPVEYLYLLGTFFGTFLACILLFILLAVVVSLFLRTDRPIQRRNPFLCAMTVGFLRMFLQLMRVRVQINGKEKIPKDQRFLLVGNHRTNFDPMILMAVLSDYDLAFVTKVENVRIPVAGKFIHAYGCQSLDRSSLRNSANAANLTAQRIKSGFCSMGIYPEGGTNRTEQPLRPFKPGSFAIAQRAEAPIVVTCMQGMNQISFNPFRRTVIQLDILSVIDAPTVAAMRSIDLCVGAEAQILACLAKEPIPPIQIPPVTEPDA